jgi:hypothetical protein
MTTVRAVLSICESAACRSAGQEYPETVGAITLIAWEFGN